MCTGVCVCVSNGPGGLGPRGGDTAGSGAGGKASPHQDTITLLLEQEEGSLLSVP